MVFRTAQQQRCGKRRKLWNKEDWEGVFGNASAIAGRSCQTSYAAMGDNGMNGMAYALDTRSPTLAMDD